MEMEQDAGLLGASSGEESNNDGNESSGVDGDPGDDAEESELVWANGDVSNEWEEEGGGEFPDVDGGAPPALPPPLPALPPPPPALPAPLPAAGAGDSAPPVTAPTAPTRPAAQPLRVSATAVVEGRQRIRAIVSVAPSQSQLRG